MNSPVYLNSPPPFPFIELQEDRQLQFFIPPQHQTSSSLSSSIFHSITQGQRASQAGETPKDQQIKADKYILHGGSSNYQVFPSSSSHPAVDNAIDVNELSIYKFVDGADEDKRDGAEPGRWASSKMRLMQKMMNAGPDKQDRVVQKFCDEEEEKSKTNLSPRSNNNNGSNNVRICSDCNTTKTPLWRSGPQGPKSLCNACGIRKRKARRAVEAAAAAAAARNCGAALAIDNSAARAKGQNKEKKSRTSCVPQYKKAPLRAQSGEKVSFEDFAVSMSKNSALGRAFPKDEEEAAILLMALSYGLLHS